MRKLLLIPVVLLSTAAFAQKEDGIVPTHCDDNARNGYYVFYGKDRPESGIPAEGKVEEGNFVNNRREGTWIKYHYDGITAKLKGNYQNNRPYGQFEKFHPNGKLREKGRFEQNHYVDSLVRYYEDGSLQYKAFFNAAGKEHGRVQYFYTNGQVEYQYTSDNGFITDTTYRYFADGNVQEIAVVDKMFAHVSGVNQQRPIRVIYTADDKKTQLVDPIVAPSPQIGDTPSGFDPEGYNTVYNSDCEVWQKGTFRAGRLWDGKVYVYDREGILLKIKVFKEGVYHSDAQE